jgi:hypothetical protein
MSNSDFESLRALAKEAEQTKSLAQKLYDKVLSNLKSKPMKTVLKAQPSKSDQSEQVKTHD